MKIKSGDKVRITAGKDKGKEGKVLQVFPKMDRIVVEGINIMTKHLRAKAGKTGQKIQFSGPIHISNAVLISSKSGKTGRVGYKMIDKNGQKEKIRVLRVRSFTEDLE